MNKLIISLFLVLAVVVAVSCTFHRYGYQSNYYGYPEGPGYRYNYGAPVPYRGYVAPVASYQSNYYSSPYYGPSGSYYGPSYYGPGYYNYASKA